jgi:hypothetical protein
MTNLEEMGHKQPPTPSRPTTQQPFALGTTTFTLNAPKPWTCNSIGSDAEKRKFDSNFSGALDPPTRLTTGPSTTVQHTTLKKDTTSCNTVYWKPFALH